MHPSRFASRPRTGALIDHTGRVLAALALCALAACGGGGSGSPSQTPAVVSTDTGAVLASKVARSGVAGTWGYTAPDGARYALMGTAKGVLVLDLRDTANPRVVDEIDGPTDTKAPGIYWREMRVYGSHAYIVSEHTNLRGGIMILDLSGLPNTVRYVGSVAPNSGGLAAHTVDIDTARGLLYLQREVDGPAPAVAPAGADPLTGTFARQSASVAKPSEPVGATNHGSIEIWDLKTDPEHPRYVTTFNQNKSVHDMTAIGDYCYVAEGYANSYSIWNVKNPLLPTLVVRWTVEAGHFAHNIWPNGDGSVVVTTEELPNGLPARVWQLHGGAAPTQLSSIQVGNATPHNVIMEGNMAYLSHYTAGAAAFDLSNPSQPKLTARFDTNADTGSNLSGCWGVYKFPGQPLMICSDISNGFYLIRLTP
jgi:choice-of-anchor B domain-containing protein